jgi:hypothetical protein
MHTAMVIAGGLVLLAVMVLIGRRLGGWPRAATGARFFLPVWLAAALVNMWFGVSRAGYSVADELPVLLVVFGIPAVIAVVAAWKCSQ